MNATATAPTVTYDEETGELNCTGCNGTGQVPCPHNEGDGDHANEYGEWCIECDTPLATLPDAEAPTMNCPTCINAEW